MSEPTYELDVRPRKTARFAIGIAILLVAFHTLCAVLLRMSDTGVYFRTNDQFAMVGLGLLLGGGVLLLARPRLRVGASGVRVRNAFSEKELPWSEVLGVSFPDGAAWARIELDDDEYIPVLAIQSNDREYAVDAVQRFRKLGQKYTAAPH